MTDLEQLIASAGYCKACGTMRRIAPCHKCGADLIEPHPAWEEPAIPDVEPIRRLAREVGYAIASKTGEKVLSKSGRYAATTTLDASRYETPSTREGLMAEHLTKALVIAAGLAVAVAYTWFWTTHGFYCPDGSHARQVGKWPLHEMSCQQ